MPVSFNRLRIAGFKSFAEPVTVELLPGLTGVVGPNGCGKSNVVEALRWVMGESSAQSLRGQEMDDVIFAGTAARPSRNIAEVTLTLGDAAAGENAAKADETPAPVAAFPPPFQTMSELQVSRRIERGNGSTYRVNGREQRARDVQTLFADLASGARSSAMISQGRVNAIVNARPEQRRMILEEAAGITGLHARRHEAELKLAATETNLERAELLRAQLETQLQGLRRQARQASRYRNLSGAIREAEAELLGTQQARVTAALEAAVAAVAAGRLAAEAAVTAAGAAEADAAGRAAVLPQLREIDSAARSALERRKIESEQLTAEEQRISQAMAAADNRLAQLKRDVAHAGRQQDEANAALERLRADEATLSAEALAHPARAEAAAGELNSAAEAVHLAETESHRRTGEAAELAARHRSLLSERTAAEAAVARIEQHLARVSAERDRIIPIAPERLKEADANHATAQAAQQSARDTADAAEKRLAAARAAHGTAREQATKADAARARLAAEVQALAEILAVRDGEQWPPMVDALTVPDGLEAALGAALGEELESASDRASARHWRELGPLAAGPLPSGATRLAELVAAPPALARALGGIGLVDDDAAGEAGQVDLSGGQMLVSRSGAVWRWDGYTIRAGTPTAATVRLQQRNRLKLLRGNLEAAEREARQAGAVRAAADAEEREAEAAERAARTAARQAEQAQLRARDEATTLHTKAAQQTAQRAGLVEQAARLSDEKETASAALTAVREAFAQLADPAAGQAAVAAARTKLDRARARESHARSERDTLTRLAAARTQRLAAIAREQSQALQRAADAGARLTEFEARLVEAEAEVASLSGLPADLAERGRNARHALAEAQTACREATSALGGAERAAETAARASRSAEAEASRTREAVWRAEAAVEQAGAAVSALAARIEERLGAAFELPVPAALPDAEAEEKARRRFERLQKERDEMGPVNLRAELEADELDKQMALIATETAELTTAIAKLRGSIGHLNREGRERLTATFQQVEQHFQSLFTRMFGGGRARLALVGSDDPLLAGLEIYAQPPGKKLATLSLLSGGEQALTALSLVFAVFRCNPAPVCVLDEVDAPLDDANVDRFCSLLEEMVRDTGTRFMVVTHHHLTMSRMDRLFGVTMQERGVSRLLSVDLRTAVDMVDEALVAAE